MQLGLTIFNTDRSMTVVDLAVEAEARGFYSLYIPEHTHIPTSRLTPAPTGDSELADDYKRSLDPLVSLGACAAVTKKLKLGTGVALVVEHDPIAYAKEWATLDFISGGRAVCGVGYGWNKEEMADHGVDYATRRERTREYMLAMNALWRDEVAEFKGEYVSFEPSWAWPKPVQQPRIRTLIGGAPGPKMFGAIAEWADGWIPIGGAGIRDSLPALRDAWSRQGRAGAPDIVPFGTLPSDDKLAYYRDIGCTEVVLRVPAADRDTVLQTLDAFAVYVGKY